MSQDSYLFTKPVLEASICTACDCGQLDMLVEVLGFIIQVKELEL